ncbi:hypothetical protein [Ralstonia mojiangensis]|uniref:hypothetical protein n=1 Tax=Ralstonia mojiangensis TaxID=2953895 RepID=UPI0021B21377|nr:hypothetical protein [Ralstonia mojiangensis]MCT7329319.1 hypothetical protein [Ralstonia mojiangensis]
MNGKFHKLIAFLVLASMLFGVKAAALEGRGVGHCYDSLASYMSETFGEGYQDDENIKQEELIQNGSGENVSERPSYYWVYDATPGVNITRTLFEKNKGEKLCAILQIPLSSGNDFRIKKDGSLPDVVKSIDSPPPGFPETKIIFKLDKKHHFYRMSECLRVRNGIEKKANCKKIFLD